MSIYKQGSWPAVVTDFGIGETKKGDPHVYVTFDVEFPDGKTSMNWKGYFSSDKAQNVAFKALQVLGFTGKTTELIDGPAGGAIKIGTKVQVAVENEPFKGDDEKMHDFYKIQWVNSPGGGGAPVQRADAGQAKAKLLALGVDAAFMKHRQMNPDPKPPVDDEPPF